MNREIKFRAWDNLTNEMICVGYHIIGEVTVFGLIDQFIKENMYEKSSLDRYNDIIEMEYIGLQDKNNKEIYEGDIIRGALDLREYDEYGRQYTGDLYTFQDKVIYKAPSFTCEKADFPLDSYELEVVGNIFETPKLLK